MEKIIHNSHPEHELELKSFQKPYVCSGCKVQGYGSRYRCDICNYELHKDCVKISPIASHKFFKNCTFKFFNQPSCTCRDCIRYCDGCAKPVYGFHYHCENKGWDLHPCCLNLKEEIFVDGVEFQLQDYSKTSSSSLSTCIWCNEKKFKDSRETRIRGWSYVSKCKNYHCHVYCASEMVIDSWKNISTSGSDNCKDNNCLALENWELPVKVLNRNQRKGNKYLRIMKLFFKTIACILLGDPTITLTCLVVDLLT